MTPDKATASYGARTTLASHPIAGVATATAGMIGVTQQGSDQPVLITSASEFIRHFGVPPAEPTGQARDRWVRDRDEGGQWWQLGIAVRGFFENGGQRLFIQRIGGRRRNTLAPDDFIAGIRPLLDVDEVSVCLVPGMWSSTIHAALIEQCETRRTCFAILDPPSGLDLTGIEVFRQRFSTGFAALYYPWVEVSDARGGRSIEAAPSGHIAGIYARVDLERGVHKAPAGETIRGIAKIARDLTRADGDRLNSEGIDTLRFFPSRGNLSWGARTLASEPEWKYVNVRRLLIFLEHSIDNGTQWVVFEPNGPQLWNDVQRTVADFLFAVWRQGALLGSKAEEAFFVKCDRTTMTQGDIDQGRLVCLIGVAAVKPAEFIIVRIGQWTADHKTP